MAMLWVDKYRPKNLETLSYHVELTKMLKKMVSQADFPHMLFYGPPGAGKHTRIQALLHEVYGNGVHRVRVEQKNFKVTKSKNVELTLLSSAYHIEINPQDAGIYDRVIVQEVIKEMASSHTIEATKNAKAFKVVLIRDVDRLTRDAQAGLRRTMEKYMGTCRLILCCENVSKVIDPLRSRCLAIRVPAPTIQQIVAVLRAVAKEEGIELPAELAMRIAQASDRNLRRAVLMLETCKKAQKTLSGTQEVKLAAWEQFTEDICNLVIQEQSPRRLMKVRGCVYELLTNCIPPTAVFKRLARGILLRVDEAVRPAVVDLAAEYESRMVRGNKAVIHIEGFIANVMLEYTKWASKIITK